ncbi:hypothetical protein ACFL36_02055 [Thermodesulfobacteriota bacterium]
MTPKWITLLKPEQIILTPFGNLLQIPLFQADTSSRCSLDRFLVVPQNADINDARMFASRLADKLRTDDLLKRDDGQELSIRIGAGYVQAQEDSLIKEVLAEAESKDNLYCEFELK